MLNTMNQRKFLIMILVAGATLFSLAVADAQAGDLPDAEKIIDDYIKATGGRDAYEKYSSMKMTGTFSMPAMGINAPLTTYQKAPNLGYTLIKSEAFGVIESGSDGTIQWEKTMMTGSKIKEGEEKAVADRQGTFNMMLHWKDFYSAAETVGTEEVDGKNCYKLVMTPNEGGPETSWFDVETKLLVKSSMTIKTEMGDISMDMYPSDYRDVEGVLVPFVAKQVLMGMQELVVTSESIEWDPEIPEGTFSVPEDVKALMK